MKYSDIVKAFTGSEQSGRGDLNATETALTDILDALSQVYPMILLANLTANSYLTLKDKGFLFDKNATYGNYDEMINNGVKNVHPNYRGAFLDAFERETLIHRYENGVRQISVNLYQKNETGEYHWVTTKVIRLEDESGDIVQVCLNEVLPQ